MTQRIEMPINKANPFVFLFEPIKSALCAMGPTASTYSTKWPRECARLRSSSSSISIKCGKYSAPIWPIYQLALRPFVPAANAYLCPLYCSFIRFVFVLLTGCVTQSAGWVVAVFAHHNSIWPKSFDGHCFIAFDRKKFIVRIKSGRRIPKCTTEELTREYGAGVGECEAR